MTGLQKLSRVGAWLVLVAGLGLALAYALGWSDVVSRLLTPELGDPDQSAGFAGLAFYGIIGATLPFLLALWGLWHLHRLLSRHSRGDTSLARHDAMVVGVAVALIAVSLVATGWLLGLAIGARSVPVLPAHVIMLVVGPAIVLAARWPTKSTQRV